MRLTIDLLRYVAGHINTMSQREISLRGYQIPAIENLGILQDAYDCIDLSENSIVIMNNFPVMKRLLVLLLHNNKIKEIGKGIGEYLPNLDSLMLTNNKIERLSQLDALAEFENLTRLNLIGNPVCKQDGYRLYVIARCAKLKHLDFRKITPAERSQAQQLWAHKLNKSKAKDIASTNSKTKTSKTKHAPKSATKQQQELDMKLTPQQLLIIKKAVDSAKTHEEFERLEQILKSGRIPHGDWNKLNKAEKPDSQ
eukprot:CAMPEP_0197023288 /NCGR_PEP_ID=MMETSP1384-20130603/4027_1 /TAXON_ID=29189 /ORGANISM="Ammonia sp." /LENGTH=253 /DNA_ID=CAMNT_0042451483 /DNA_START=16 /DNA_END=777 /DNA_ORIENTATION=+